MIVGGIPMLFGEKPLEIGDSYEGGFFAGEISTTANGVATHRLVVSPKATGEGTSKRWGIRFNTTGMTSLIDGPGNSANLSTLGVEYAAAIFCEGLTINGFSDWYLPSKDELEVLYYFLKPSATSNNTSWGSNGHAVSPEPISTNYTANNPPQCPAGINFRTGESEAMANYYHWSSSEYDSGSAWGTVFFDTGEQFFNNKNDAFFTVRAVRRVAI